MHRSPVFFVASFLLTAISSLARAQQPLAPAVAPTNRAPTLDEVFTTLDKDGDGRISKAEALAPYDQRFAAWDADGDGFAQRHEIQAYRTRLGIDDQGQRIAPANQPNQKAGKQKTGSPKGGKAAPRAEVAASVLKEPVEWRLETFPVPPPFAPDIKLTGSEEARFSPGMYDTNANDYFTYVMAFTLDGTPQLTEPELKEFIEKYFRGLSVAVGRRKSFSIDPAKMLATVASAPVASTVTTDHRFDFDLIFFDSFTDGRQITLHLEAKAMARPDAKHTYLVLLVSPASKDAAIWQKLRDIEKKATSNIP